MGATQHPRVHRTASNVNTAQVEKPCIRLVDFLIKPYVSIGHLRGAKHCVKYYGYSGSRARWPGSPVVLGSPPATKRFGGPTRCQEAPSLGWVGEGKTGLHLGTAGKLKNPRVPAPWRSHQPGLLPGLALSRRRSCSGPRARGTPGLSFPTRPEGRCTGQLAPGTETHSATCKASPFASLGLSLPSWPQRPVTAVSPGRT